MSRTETLRQGGARERGGSGGAPFVKWGDAYAWVEGKIVGFWTGQFGDNVTLEVAAASDNLEMAGKDEDGNPYRVKVEAGVEANVGLNSATLEGTIKPEDRGKHFHIAFEGWDTNKREQRYRMFAVLELEDEPDREPKYPENPVKAGVGPGAPGEEGPEYDDDDFEDDLPF